MMKMRVPRGCASRYGMVPAMAFGAALGAAPALGQGADGCSRDAVRVGGTPVDVVLCVPASGQHRRKEGRAVDVVVSETLSANGRSFTRNVPLEFMDGGETTRTIDDVSLAPLGIAKSLHVTLGYRSGAIRLEHALLLPDAIGLK
jgi:hypothetical protein